MTDPIHSRWTIRSEMFEGSVSHSVWHGPKRIAADIGSLEAASVVCAAPELLAFAQTVLRLARQSTGGEPDLVEILSICRQMIDPLRSGGPLRAFDSNMAPSAAWSRPVSRTTMTPSKTKSAPKPAAGGPLFEEVFKATLDQIRDEALGSGWTLQRLSKEVGMSRAQFARWRKSPPATIQAVTKLQAAVRAGLRESENSRNYNTRGSGP